MMRQKENSMTVTTLGRVNVATPGTPVPLSTDPNQRAAKIFAQAVPGLTGKGYLGTSNMIRRPAAVVMRILWPNSAGGFSGHFIVETSCASHSLKPFSSFSDIDAA